MFTFLGSRDAAYRVLYSAQTVLYDGQCSNPLESQQAHHFFVYRLSKDNTKSCFEGHPQDYSSREDHSYLDLSAISQALIFMASDSANTDPAAQNLEYTPEAERLGGDYDTRLLEAEVKPDDKPSEETPRKSEPVNTGDEAGQLKTALVQVLEQRCMSTVETLLTNGAIPNATDGPGEGRSLLQRAVENSEIFTDRFLLVKKFFGAILDMEKATKLSRLIGGPEETVCNKLREITDNRSGKIQERVPGFLQALHEDSNQCQIIEALICRGADLSVRTKEGETLLHLAACSAPRLRVILSHIQRQGTETLKVDAKDSEGRTPLHYAAAAGNSSAMRILISHGADINARDKYDATVLHYAVECRVCIAIALEAGATAATMDILGRSPGHYLAMLAENGEEGNMNRWQKFQMQPGSPREQRELEGRRHECFTPIPRKVNTDCVIALEDAYCEAGHTQWMYMNDDIGNSFSTYAFCTKAAHPDFKDQANWVKKMKRRYKLRLEPVKKLLAEGVECFMGKLESKQDEWFADRGKGSGAEKEEHRSTSAPDNASEEWKQVMIYSDRTKSDVVDGCDALRAAIDSLQ